MATASASVRAPAQASTHGRPCRASRCRCGARHAGRSPARAPGGGFGPPSSSRGVGEHAQPARRVDGARRGSARPASRRCSSMWCLIVPGARNIGGADLGVREPGLDQAQDLALARDEADARRAPRARARTRGRRRARGRRAAARGRGGPCRSHRSPRGARGAHRDEVPAPGQQPPAAGRLRRSHLQAPASPTPTSATSKSCVSGTDRHGHALLDPDRPTRAEQPAQSVAHDLLIIDHQDPERPRGGNPNQRPRFETLRDQHLDPPSVSLTCRIPNPSRVGAPVRSRGDLSTTWRTAQGACALHDTSSTSMAFSSRPRSSEQVPLVGADTRVRSADARSSSRARGAAALADAEDAQQDAGAVGHVDGQPRDGGGGDAGGKKQHAGTFPSPISPSASADVPKDDRGLRSETAGLANDDGDDEQAEPRVTNVVAASSMPCQP